MSYGAFINIAFTGAILLGAYVVLQPFLLAVAWAIVIAIASWPVHQRIREAVKGNHTHAAILSTTAVALALVAPTIGLLVMVAQEVYTGVSFLLVADKQGAPMPVWLPDLPWVGETLAHKWETYLSHPNQLSGLMDEWIAAKLNVIQEWAQVLIMGFTARVATFFFALMVLFFLYRDGDMLIARVNKIGYKWLHGRWPSYAYNIPPSLRAAVNGLVIVGLGEAVILSVLYGLFGIPSAVLLGLLSAGIALIPMAAPLLFALIGVLMFYTGSPMGGIFVFSFGTALVMAADYVVRPLLIQGSVEIPFLAVLFGILGGIATMGVLGLIIGPVFLVLLIVLFREASIDEAVDLGF